MQIQVSVGPEDDGRRTVTVHSSHDGGWTRHAQGFLTPNAPVAPHDLTEWPPPAAEPLPVDDAYATFREHGYSYGPAFQGLRAAWRIGDDLYAEVTLPDPALPDSRPLRHPPRPAGRLPARRDPGQRRAPDDDPVRLERRGPARGGRVHGPRPADQARR
nr:hypothetical protein GCM10020092_032260 [Actinoplanes digitatis]